MTLTPLTYTLPLYFAAGLAFLTASMVWRRRNPVALPFILLMMAVAEWSIAYALEIQSVDLSGKIFWSKVKYLGVTAVPAMWLILASEYGGRKLLRKRRRLAWLSIEPLLTIGLIWTNHLHGLIYSDLGLISVGTVTLKAATHGPWFWVHFGYSYILMFVGTLWMVEAVIRSPDLYRWQVVIALIGALTPWIGNVLYTSGLNPIKHLDLTPFGFAMTGFTIGLGLFRIGLLDVTPLARDIVMENMKEGVMVLNKRNQIIDMNMAVQTLLQCERSRTIGKRPGKVLPALDLVFSGQSKLNNIQESIHLGEGESRVTIDLHATPVFDKKGRYTGKVVILHDITRLRQATEHLERAKVEAEEASRAKSNFLANMSHEFRTPLNHIIGFTELIVDKKLGELNDIQEEYLNDVLFSSKHLLALINDILDLSKVEAGKMELELSDVRLRDLLENSLNMVREKAFDHRIKLALESDNIPETVRADERKLKQIMYNLLSNAVKFTPDGGSVTVAARYLRRVDGRLRNSAGGVFEMPETVDTAQLDVRSAMVISVKDTGIGMKSEDLHRVFGSFEQVESTASRRFDGTGLGLSLTKSLVNLHGGGIWAESEGKDRGSTFYVIIPV